MPAPTVDRHSDGVQLRGGDTARSTLMTVTGVVAVGVMLFGVALGIGLRWQDGWWGHGPADSAALDYASLRTRFERLRAEYVQSLFGGSVVSASHSETAGGPSERQPDAVEVEHAFTNDSIASAYDVPSVPFRATTDTTGATREASEPSDCSPVGGTEWYRYRSSGALALFADTFGSSGPIALGVFTGESPDSLTPVGCDLNVLGNAQVGFRPTAGQTYWFQLTAPTGGGPTAFELAEVGLTTVETVAPAGASADGIAIDHPDISADGRFVIFMSKARNLTGVRTDCAGGTTCDSLYVRDREMSSTALVATSGSPYAADDPRGSMILPSVSPDGRYIGFTGYPSVAGTPVGYTGDADGGEPGPNGNAYVFDRVTGRAGLVSRNSAGEPGRRDPVFNNGAFWGSLAPAISAEGRYVTFSSDAANLGGPHEPGRTVNVYRRDRLTGETRVVSTDANGDPMHANSFACTGRNISSDGRRIAFLSTYRTGTDGPGGSNAILMAYVWDEATGRSRLVSRLLPGQVPVSHGNYCIVIAQSGSHVGFVSRDALVPEDTNGTPDVYVYDVAADSIRRVSVSSAGEQTVDPNVAGEDGAVFARSVTLSADGRYAAFDSAAPGLAPGAEYGRRQVYVHDLLTGATTLASVSSVGEPLPGESTVPYISADGRSVVFMHSFAGRVDVLVHQLR